MVWRNMLLLPPERHGGEMSGWRAGRWREPARVGEGGGRGVDSSVIARLEDLVQGEFRPDLTLLLDVPVAVGLARASQRGSLDRFEQEQVSFFERVRAAYLDMAAVYPERYRVIDASQSLENVQQQIRACLPV